MRLGASPGKKIMSLRVVPENRPEGRLDLNDAILRMLGYLTNGAISWFIMDIALRTFLPQVRPLDPGARRSAAQGRRPGGLILPYLLILGSGRKALQDMFSRSIVIRVDR